MATQLRIMKALVESTILWLLISIAWPAQAAWNAPTCNPDTVGPTDPTCNVAAPLNVSAAGQSKSGTLEIQNTLSAADMVIDSSLGGSGGLVITTATGAAISVTHNSPSARAIYVATNSSSPGVEISQSGTGVGLDVSSATVGLLVNGVTDGIAATGGSYGGSFTTSGTGAVLAENTGSGAGVIAIGGADPTTFSLPGSLSSYSNDGVVSGSDTGYGIVGVTNGSSTTSAILGYSKAGYGVIGYSDSYEGVYGNTDDLTSAYGGYFCNQQTNCAGLGGPVYAGYFNNTVFIQTNTAGETGLVIETTNTNIGASITTDQGGTGLLVKTSNGSSGPGLGIGVTVDPFEVALETNAGFIHNAGGYDGGVLYPNENAGGGLHPNVEIRQSHSFVLPDPGIQPRSVEFDGSDIWVAATNPAKVFRFDAATNHLVEDYDLTALGGSSDVRELLYIESDTRGDVIFVFGLNGEYQAIPLYADKTAIPPSAATGAAGTIYGAVFDGDSIWLSTDQGIYDWDFEGTLAATPVVTNSQSYDIIFADGLIWASDYKNNSLVVIDPATQSVTATLPAGSGPRGLAYDGQYLWVANAQSNSIMRFHTENYATEEFDVSSLGSQPRHLVYDGSKLWITFFNSAVVGAFDVARRAPAETVTVDQGPNYITFDGTNVWVTNTQASTLSKIPTGTGFGSNPGPYQNGFLIAGQDDRLYCIFIDSAGVFKQSTALNNCGY